MTFESKVAFVSGAAEGLGFATARAFAEAGAAVALTDLNARAADVAAGRLVQAGHRAMGFHCDVTDETSVESAIRCTVAQFGRLDAAFNCAGVQVSSAETADALTNDFDRAIAVNLKGVWLCMKHQLRHMRKQGSGAIVNCLSPSGLAGIAGLGADNASNHGVIGLTRSAALEYARRGIRINAISPRTTDRPMNVAALRSHPQSVKSVAENIPLSRTGTPEETILWLCSSRARFMIGQVVASMADARGSPSAYSSHRAAIINGPYPPSRA